MGIRIGNDSYNLISLHDTVCIPIKYILVTTFAGNNCSFKIIEDHNAVNYTIPQLLTIIA